MFSVIRVRLKLPSKQVEQCDADPIEPPDLEMWAVYENGKSIDDYEGLYPTRERAEIICENRNKMSKDLKANSRAKKVG